MINNEIYQKIFDRILVFLPSNWQKVIVYLEYGDESYSMSFYVKDHNAYLNCFDLPDVIEDDLYSAFDEIDGFVSEERDKTKSNNWANMTMSVDNKGNMHTDFDYTDLSENGYAYESAWKKRYLV